MNELLRILLFLPPQASSIARELDQLHFVVITATMIGAALVTAVGGYYLLRYRQTATPIEAGAPPAHALGQGLSGVPPSLELAVVAALLGLFVFFWYLGFDQFMRIRVAPERTLDVYVTAKQWMWSFAYPDGRSSAATLYVPARTPVKLIMTSRDVIHSFYVPEFRLKQDVVPGRYTTLWFQADRPGDYQILCTEYCGLDHSRMRGRVVVVEPSRWRQGGEQGEPPLEVASIDLSAGRPLAELGERAAVAYGCLRCHTVDGTPHIGPSWAGLYGSSVPLQRGGEVRVDELYLTESMMEPLAKIHRGFAAVMPSYFGALPAPETAAIVEYIKSLRDVPERPQLQTFTPRVDGGVPLPAVPGALLQPQPPGTPRTVRAAPQREAD